MTKPPSALGYALPLIVAIALVGGFAAFKVSSAKPTIGVSGVEAPRPSADQQDAPRWLKGQTHAHTNQGPDSVEPVESVLAYYADAGFDFVVLTDHNHVTVAQGPEGLLVIPGAEITQSRERCDPMPPGTDKCAMHMNALFVDPAKANDAFLEPPTSRTVDVFRAELSTAKQLGGVAQLNHPNYQYTAADPELLATLAEDGLRFIEVMNEAEELHSAGDEQHPSVEILWDQALQKGAKLYAIASDDAHNYSDAEKVRAQGRSAAVVNRGYIYVRAKKDPASIREAMERGDFYATNGVVLRQLDTQRAAGGATTYVQVAAHHEAPVIRIIADGKVVREVRGHEASFGRGPSASRYVRAVVEADGKRALIQPLFAAE